MHTIIDRYLTYPPRTDWKRIISRRTSKSHGKFEEWVPEPTGWALQAVKVDGVVAVPRVGMIMEYILKVCVEGPT